MLTMWNVKGEELQELHSIRLVITQNSSSVTYATVIQAWQHDHLFRDFFIQLLSSLPFDTFRWETPPVTNATINQPFECVVIASPSLDRAPDRHTFAPYFDEHQPIVEFLNLGKDAILVVPCSTEPDCNFSHLGAFVQNATKAQQHALWICVGQAMAKRVNHQPVWLSTAGGGVAWLHVRLDNFPKYYHHQPYRNMG